MVNKIYKTLKYEKENVSIDVRFDLENNTIWLTQNEIASILSLTVNAVSKNIKKIEKEASVIAWEANTETIGADGKTYKTKLYNLDMIEKISLHSKSTTGHEFVKWAREKLNDTSNTSLNEYSPYEAVEQTYLKYYDGEISMDVKLSLNKVWLTQEQIAKLFDKDVSVISRHIKNILATGECDKSNLQKMQIPFSDKLVNIYDMDVIISIGFRVSSTRGLEFRRWSRNILKDYISEGYSINDKRCLECKTNLISLNNRVEKLEQDKEKVEDIVFGKKNDFIDKGDVISPLLKIMKIFFLANQKIVIIDNYADSTLINLLDKIKVNVIIITKDNSPLNKLILNANIRVINENQSHDRYILIDDKYTYKLGTSINSIGKDDTEIDFLKDIEPSYILRNTKL